MISNENKLQIKTEEKNTINFHCPFFIWSKCTVSFHFCNLYQCFHYLIFICYLFTSNNHWDHTLWLCGLCWLINQNRSEAKLGQTWITGSHTSCANHISILKYKEAIIYGCQYLQFFPKHNKTHILQVIQSKYHLSTYLKKFSFAVSFQSLVPFLIWWWQFSLFIFQLL